MAEWRGSLEGLEVNAGLARASRTRAADYFDEHAERYDRRYEGRDAEGYALRSRLETVLRLVGDGPGDVLDAGMGAGRLCAELEGRGWTVSGVDAAPEMVAAARKRLPAAAASRLHCAPIEALPFPTDSFDVVTATGVLEYADVMTALSEVARVLRPEGRAYISYPNPQALYGLWKTRAWYPVARVLKRSLRRPNPEMPHGAGELAPPRFEASLHAAGLAPQARHSSSYLPVLTPLERLLPRLTVRLGERLEQRGSTRSARLFATQIVYEAQRVPEVDV